MNTTNPNLNDVPDEVMNSCISMAKSIATLLKPYLQPLTDQQRHDLFKMGDKSAGYISKMLGYVETHPQFIPQFMEVEEFKKDAKIVATLQPLTQILNPLCSDIDDTRMLAGSGAMTYGQLYYASVNTAAKNNVPGSRTIYEDLNARFPGRKTGSAGTDKPGTSTGQ